MILSEIARFDCHPDWDIYRVGKFCNANGNLLFIGSVIPAVSILSKPGLISVKDKAGPIHVDVGMLKIVPRKKDILDVRDDFIPISTKDFKNTVKCSFTEWREYRTPILRVLFLHVLLVWEHRYWSSYNYTSPKLVTDQTGGFHVR